MFDELDRSTPLLLPRVEPNARHVARKYVRRAVMQTSLGPHQPRLVCIASELVASPFHRSPSGGSRGSHVLDQWPT